MAAAPSFETIRYELDQGVLTVTLNRPDVLNALNDQMAEDLIAAFKQAARDDQVRAVIVTGAGRGFCAGQDLKAISDQAGRRSIGDHLRKTWNPIITRIRQLEKPVIAAVNGAAAGAGCSLALACDLRLAAESARFIEIFARVGLIPDSGSTFLLPRLVGLARTFEMCFTTDPVDAATAERWGLINRVVPDDRLLEEARALAARLAAGPTRAYGLTKRAVNRALTLDLEGALEYEAHLQEAAGRTADHQEGVRAFLEKREPRYEGK
ncbi:MAG TPA: enoyl-CoA hydratase-related protein [Bacillota bacterium]